MSEWVEKPLGQLASLEIGGTPSRDVPAYWADPNADGHPWVSIADLRAGRVAETSERITDLGVRLSNVKPIKRGTVLMTFKLTIGEVAFADCDLFTNEAIVALSPKSREISPQFLYHVLPRAAKAAISDAAIKGATLNKEKIAKIVIRFPTCKNSQDLISRILRALDTQIEATEALIAKQERVRSGLMQDLFTRGVDEHGQLRPPRDQAPHLYHQTSLGWLPLGWEVDALQSLAGTDITYGIVQAGPHVLGGIPYIRTGDMSGEALEQEALLCTTPVIAGNFQRSRVQSGEIVIAIRATIGKALMVPPELDGANLTQGTARFSANGRLNRQFALRMLRCRQVELQTAIHTKGTTFSEITLGDLRRVLAPFPYSLDEQDKIATMLQASDDRLDYLNKERGKLRLQKSGLMQDLLTGKVPVTPLLATVEAIAA